MIAIFKRELKSYFTSMIGPIFIAMLCLFFGIFFMVYNISYGYPYFSMVLSGTLIIYMIAVPILTMKSMADERRTKTDQLLLTSPITVPEIVLGKFLAMVAVLLIPILVACICPMVIKSFGNAHLMVDYSTIFAFFLLGCAYIAIGMFVSSLTESQIISTVVSFAILFGLYLMNDLSNFYPATALASLIGFSVILALSCVGYYLLSKNWIISGAIGVVGLIILAVLYFVMPGLFEGAMPAIFAVLCPTTYLSSFASYSVFDLRGIIYYLSIIIFFCFLTVQSIQKRRWS